jgi:hypothetical protein
MLIFNIFEKPGTRMNSITGVANGVKVILGLLITGCVPASTMFAKRDRLPPKMQMLLKIDLHAIANGET